MMMFLSGLAALILSALIGWFLIPVLRALKAGQSIKEIGPSWHMSKQGTPTMGGFMFMASISICVVAFGWRDMAGGDFSALFVLVFALVYGAIGFVDDYAKVKKHENTGLTAGWKFLLQLAAAIAFLALLRFTHHLSSNLYIPFVNTEIPLPWPVYMVFAAFVIVGCVNSVNLTDGIDGLASSVTAVVMAFFMGTAMIWKFTTLGIFSSALCGSLLGFYALYNRHPAKCFMGDTGSLFLGGAVAALAFAFDMPLVLIPVGIIYILETLSDIIQVGYFKATHGKRFFKMAPLHHHLERCGWSEVKIVTVFVSITAVFCLLAYYGIRGRYL